MQKNYIKPFHDFLKSEQIGGALLLFCVIISLLIANSSWGTTFNQLLAYEIGFKSDHLALRYPLSLWVNDGLMAIFFLLVGLEIKREILEGELSSLKKATMPLFAALGGMLVPASIFVLFNQNTPTSNGWAIPMATDIAFALGILSLLRKQVPISLTIFLAALAVADDLGAILVIAFFYTEQLHWNYLFYALGVCLLLYSFNFLGIKRIIFYIIPGILLWYFIHHSGIHATIAGVLLAFSIPTSPDKSASPLEKLEHAIVRPVTFLIMPIFALANTNIQLESSMINGLTSPLGLGIIFGLALGKPLGIVLFSWISVKLGLSSLPSRANWKHIIGLGMLAGIGFTMSIFVSLLSFSAPEYQTGAKFCVLLASLIAGLSGYVFFQLVHNKKKA